MHNKFKRFYLILLIMIVAMGTLLYSQYRITKSIVEDELLTSAELSLGSMENDITDWLNEKRHVIETTASFLKYNKWSEDIIFGYFNLVMDENEDFKSVYFGTPDNKMINASGWSPPSDFDLTKRPWYIKAIETDEIIMTDKFTNASLDDEIITIALAIRDDNDVLIGVVGGDISFNTIMKTIQNYQFEGMNNSIIINEHNEILSIINKYDDLNQNQLVISEAVKYLNTHDLPNQFDIESLRVNDENGYLSHQPIENTPWRIVTYIFIENMLTLDDNLSKGVFVIFGFSMVLLLGIAIIINQSIIRPISKVEKGIDKINPEVNSAYRLESLEKSDFSSLVDKINSLLSRVEKYVLLIKEDRINLEKVNSELNNALLLSDQTRNELFSQKLNFEALFKNSTDAIIRFDKNHLIVDVNDAFTSIFAYMLEEIKGLEIDSVIAGDSNARELTKLVFEGHEIRAEGKRKTKDGTMIEMTITGIPIIIDNELIGGYGIYSDISKRKKDERDLIKQKIIFEELFKNSTDAIVVFNDQHEIVDINENFTLLFDYQADEVIGKNIDNVISNEKIKLETTRLTEALFMGEKTIIESVRYGKHEKAKEVLVKGVPIISNGKIIGGYGIYVDISERKKAEQEILYISYHDQLTGLYNRRYFEEELKRLDTERNLPIALIMADMNGLKLINDAFGHQKGDELLRKTAEILKKACREDEIIARLGGDEFVILLPKTSFEEAENIVKRIRKECQCEVVGNVEISISFGWDSKTNKAENIAELYKRVEDFMYRNKLTDSPSVRGRMFETIIRTLHEKNKREEMHSSRVSSLCVSIAQEMKMKMHEIDELKTAGWLHDIGKIAIDERILNKPGRLSNDEWTEIKRHPEIGYRILNAVNEMADISEYVLTHHEWWDGSGYPRGLKGNEIPLQGRIIGIADAFDAMTNARTYREVLSIEQAIVELRDNSGTQFDPEIVSLFIDKVLKKHNSY